MGLYYVLDVFLYFKPLKMNIAITVVSTYQSPLVQSFTTYGSAVCAK